MRGSPLPVVAALAWLAVDARPPRDAANARPRHAGRRARRAVDVLAARADRRSPALRRPRERRRLVRRPALSSARRSSGRSPTSRPEPRWLRRRRRSLTRALGRSSSRSVRGRRRRRSSSRCKGGAILDEFRGSKTAEVTQTPNRLADLSSSNRWTWWKEAWQLLRGRAGRGQGRRRRSRSPGGRSGRLDRHDRAARPAAPVPGRDRDRRLPAAARADRGRRDGGGAAVRRVEPAERAAAAALALGAGAFALHSLVEIHWEFVAVGRAGVLLVRRARRPRRVAARCGRPGPSRSRRPSVAVGALYSLTAPYASGRLVDSAYEAIDRAADGAARRRRPLGPLARTRSRPTRCSRSATPSRPSPTRPPRSPVLPGCGDAPAGELEHLVRARLVRVLHRALPRRRCTISTGPTASTPTARRAGRAGCSTRRGRRSRGGERSASRAEARHGRCYRFAPRISTSFAPCSCLGFIPSSGPTRVRGQADVPREAVRLGCVAGRRHQAPGRIAGAWGVLDLLDHVPAGGDERRGRGGGAVDPVAVQDDHARLRARQDPGRMCGPGRLWLGLVLRRRRGVLRRAGGLRGRGVDVRRERASEQHHAQDDQRDQLDRRDAGGDERGGAPGADELDLRWRGNPRGRDSRRRRPLLPAARRGPLTCSNPGRVREHRRSGRLGEVDPGAAARAAPARARARGGRDPRARRDGARRGAFGASS